MERISNILPPLQKVRATARGVPTTVAKQPCPCNDHAHNHPEVATEWDWEANEGRTPETVAASSSVTAAWNCRLCGQMERHCLEANIGDQKPPVWGQTSLVKTSQPNMSN